MEKAARIFKSPADAENADREFYRSLSADERVQMALEIIWGPYGDNPPKMEKTARIVRVPLPQPTNDVAGDRRRFLGR